MSVFLLGRTSGHSGLCAKQFSAPLMVSLLLLMNISCLSRATVPEALPPLQARLELAAGEVTLLEGDSIVQVYSGAALPANARIRAGAGTMSSGGRGAASRPPAGERSGGYVRRPPRGL